MSKKKRTQNRKRAQGKRARAKHSRSARHRPAPGSRERRKAPIGLLLVGGVGVFVLLFVGGWLINALIGLSGRGPDASSPARTTVGTGTADAGRDRDASSKSSASSAPELKGTLVEKPPASRTSGGDVLMAALPSSADAALFGGDADLGTRFADVRAQMDAGESPAKIKRTLAPLLGRARDNPGREHILAAMAMIELRLRKGDAALKYIDELKRDFPDGRYREIRPLMEAEARLLSLSRAEGDGARLRDLLSSLHAVERELESKGLRTYAAFIRAGILGKLGRADEAIATYRALARDDPDSDRAPRALREAASILQEQGRFEEAIEVLSDAARIEPNARSRSRMRQTIRELKLIGRPAPELRVEAWASGAPTPLSSQRGRYVLVVFWQTWCPHCRKELPHLATLYRTYEEKGLTVIGATRNDKRQDESKLADFLRTHDIPFPVARIDPTLWADYAVRGVPAAVLIDRDGVIRWRGHPARLTEEKIDAYLSEEGAG